MVKKVFLGLLLIFFYSLSYSQVKAPAKRPINVGFFTGIGGTNYSLIPGMDVYYKGNILRIAPGYRVYSLGYIREILPISKTFYNCYWIFSVYGTIGKEDDLHASPTLQTLTSNFYKATVLGGIKYYFARRLYTQLQVGYIYTKYKTTGYPVEKIHSPYYEFSIGINIYKSYINESDFE